MFLSLLSMKSIIIRHACGCWGVVILKIQGGAGLFYPELVLVGTRLFSLLGSTRSETHFTLVLEVLLTSFFMLYSNNVDSSRLMFLHE